MVKIIAREDISEYIGYRAAPTQWILINQDRIDDFADVTEDHQFIHVDPEAAKNTPFGGTIAHGFLTLSMIAKFAAEFSLLINGAVMGLNYGFDKVRFLAPVKVGSRIRANAQVIGIDEKQSGQYLIRYAVEIEIEGEKTPAVIAEWLGLVFVEQPVGRGTEI